MGKKKTQAVKQKKASSATARSSSGKAGPSRTDVNKLFVQFAIHIEPDPTAASSTSQSYHPQDKWDSILALLQRLEESNQTIITRVSDLESQKSVNPTVSNPQLQSDMNTRFLQSNKHSLTSTVNSGTQLTGSDAQVSTMQAQVLQAPLTSAATSQAIPTGLPTPPTEQHTTHFSSDGTVHINILRESQNVSHSVAQVLASYEAQARQDVYSR